MFVRLGRPAFLHENQIEQAGLTQRVLGDASRATCERGDGVDVQGTDPLAGIFLQRLAIGRDRLLLLVRPLSRSPNLKSASHYQD